jgi:hypothetical protein
VNQGSLDLVVQILKRARPLPAPIPQPPIAMVGPAARPITVLPPVVPVPNQPLYLFGPIIPTSVSPYPATCPPSTGPASPLPVGGPPLYPWGTGSFPSQQLASPTPNTPV